MEENEYFTVSFYDDEYKKALGYLGTKSGRDTDKVKDVNFTPVKCGESVSFKELILKYKDKWIWDGHYGLWGLSINPSPIVKQLLLEYFPDKIEYEYFDLNDRYDSTGDSRELSQLDKLVLDYTKEYGLEKLICCINITTLGENNDSSAH